MMFVERSTYLLSDKKILWLDVSVYDVFSVAVIQRSCQVMDISESAYELVNMCVSAEREGEREKSKLIDKESERQSEVYLCG